MIDFKNILSYFSLLCVTLTVSGDTVNANRIENLRFPEGFEFGVSTSAYQIEGAWDEDGKGLSMWDHLVKTNPTAIEDESNGDVAANSYYLYKRDVEMLKELGVTSYRLSISWTRILPNGRSSYINPLGIAYYNALIDELLANDITPYVTIYHWDLPQNLSEQNGWLNEEIVDWFGEYARIVFEHFGDRVKDWVTINEPYVHCMYGYGNGKHAPQVNSPGIGYYECGRNILLANARAYHIYDEEFRAEQKGRIGFVVDMAWPIPETEKEEDIQAAEDFRAFRMEHYLHPVFSKEGNYPQRLIDLVGKASETQGLNASRLRPFNDEQIDYIRGSADFLGLNHYTTSVVYRNESVIGIDDIPSMDDDMTLGAYSNTSLPLLGWSRDYAPALYNILIYLRDNYPDVTTYVTENGCSTDIGLVDDGRVQYLRNYITAVLQALDDGANVQGYFIWSLMDNFEWEHGYITRFGLYEVDFQDPDRTRTPRMSALVYKEIIRSREIDLGYSPQITDTVRTNNACGYTSWLAISLVVFSLVFRSLSSM